MTRADLAGKSWYGVHTYTAHGRTGKIVLVYDFHPDGTVTVEQSLSVRGRGTWDLRGDRLVLHYRHEGQVFDQAAGAMRTQQSAAAMIYRGTYSDGLFRGGDNIDRPEAKFRWEYSLKPLEECKGIREVCGHHVLCRGPDGAKSLTEPDFTRPTSALRSSFDDFYSLFSCAVAHGLKNLYVSRIRFPLRHATFDHGIPQAGTIVQDDFHELQIGPTGKTPSEEMIDVRGDTSASVIKAWPYERPRPIQKYWLFDSVGGVWKLTGIEDLGSEDHDVENIFYHKHCHPAVYQDGFAHSAANDEDFREFLVKFYCAVKDDMASLYSSRIKFPIPYVVRHTEGEDRGMLADVRKDAWMLTVSEIFPVVTVTGTTAYVSMERYGSGESVGWTFKRIENLWYLVSLNVGSY